jgi:hypothetical protein
MADGNEPVDAAGREARDDDLDDEAHGRTLIRSSGEPGASKPMGLWGYRRFSIALL